MSIRDGESALSLALPSIVILVYWIREKGSPSVTGCPHLRGIEKHVSFVSGRILHLDMY